MSYTEGRWEQGTPFPDMTIFVGPDELKNTSGTATLTLNAPGDLSLNIGASQTCVFLVTEASMLRSGVYANAALDQSQFGTAASQPGPSLVPGTSGPLGQKAGYPPIPASQMTTLGAVLTGPMPKGIQINSIVPIYSVQGGALSSIALGVTSTKFANNAAFVVTNLLAKAQNGLLLANTTGAATPYTNAVAMPTPSFIVGAATGVEALLELDLTTGAGTARLYGINMNCSFNFN